MSNTTWWMPPQTLDRYRKILEGLNKGIQEHRRLIDKLKKKTITEDEIKDLKKVIELVNKFEKQRLLLLDQNPLKVGNILKAIREKRDG